MALDPTELRRQLEFLSESLTFNEAGDVHWIVCGGVALALQGLSSRPTSDVDVLASWEPAERRIRLIKDFDPVVTRCIEQVQNASPELQTIDKKWVNLGPSHLAELGLPAGFEGRLKRVQIRDNLHLYLLDRADLVCLKLYAASDRHARRQSIHFQDLIVLAPSGDEVEKAIEWLRMLPGFEERREEIKFALEETGHEDATYYL
jgi:hypothetical protein